MQYLYHCPHCHAAKVHVQPMADPLPHYVYCTACSLNFERAENGENVTVMLQKMQRVYEPAMMNLGERGSHDQFTNFQMRNL